LENIFGKMEDIMKDNGNKIKYKEKDNFIGQTKGNM